MGYSLFRVRQGELSPTEQKLEPKPYVLENALLRVEVDATTGDLASIWDKNAQRQVLQGAGNQLQAFTDQGQYWDAWNIDPNYAAHPLPPSQLQQIRWLEQGPLRWQIQVVRTINQSTFDQIYTLEVDTALIKIATTVDWQERHVLVKAAFPLNLEADWITCETACGAIERPTRARDDREKAQWEVPALQWADLGTGDWGVSLLNDGKYGYDGQPGQLRLTLLRGAAWPDPDADRGQHQFTYALYPHQGDWRSARTVHQGYELNQSILYWFCPPQPESGPGTLPPQARLVDLGAANLILMAVKQSEDAKTWVLRCYESHGQAAEIHFHSDLGLQMGQVLNLLEQPLEQPQSASTALPPWRIASFGLRLPPV